MVLNGAIASGKDAVSRELAGILEAEGSPSAVIGLDEVWLMLHHQHGRKPSSLEHWLLARKAAALLTDEFFASGIASVIVNGPFFTGEERVRYLEHVRTAIRPFYVTLRVSFDEAYRRAQRDPGRIASKDREWLAERHRLTQDLLPTLRGTDLIIDTDGRTPAEVAGAIRAALP